MLEQLTEILKKIYPNLEIYYHSSQISIHYKGFWVSQVSIYYKGFWVVSIYETLIDYFQVHNNGSIVANINDPGYLQVLDTTINDALSEYYKNNKLKNKNAKAVN